MEDIERNTTEQIHTISNEEFQKCLTNEKCNRLNELKKINAYFIVNFCFGKLGFHYDTFFKHSSALFITINFSG